MDAVFMLRQGQEKTLEGNGKRYWTFVDMEKVFDRVPREVVYLSLRKKGVSEKIVRLVRSMYVDAKTEVRIGTGTTGGFEIRVGVRNRIKIAWQKWRELTCVLCDNKMPIQIKGKVYKSIIS